MKPFRSTDEMIDTHELMFGSAGRFCAEAVCRHVTLFDDPLRIRVALAPIELGPYNQHRGYTNWLPQSEPNAFRLILGNRHICALTDDGSIVLRSQSGTEDFIVHELTHHRQDILLARQGSRRGMSRGVHRDSGSYGAIAEAAPRYLGVAFPQTIWPKLKSKRTGVTVIKIHEPTRLTEVEACHWPHTFRTLISARDNRLAAIKEESGRATALVLHPL